MTEKQQLVARLLEEKKITVQEASILLTEAISVASQWPVYDGRPFWGGVDLSTSGDTSATFEYNIRTGEYKRIEAQ